ncbi:MAG: hypothetical protein LH473_03955, partial [Chitinophagales bacterium]|nr:hypothetical protein [Chitinophagales bacterium]
EDKGDGRRGKKPGGKSCGGGLMRRIPRTHSAGGDNKTHAPRYFYSSFQKLIRNSSLFFSSDNFIWK